MVDAGLVREVAQALMAGWADVAARRVDERRKRKQDERAKRQHLRAASEAASKSASNEAVMR